MQQGAEPVQRLSGRKSLVLSLIYMTYSSSDKDIHRRWPKPYTPFIYRSSNTKASGAGLNGLEIKPQ